MHGHALRPQQDVAVRQRNPEVVFSQTQQDRIVEDAAFRVCNKDILSLPDGPGSIEPEANLGSIDVHFRAEIGAASAQTSSFFGMFHTVQSPEVNRPASRPV